MTDIPPQRYRIVERKGRIVVTDTWAERGRPTMPRSPIGGASRRAPSQGIPAGVARLRTLLVGLVCLAAKDDAGRHILTTHDHFDEKGPRAIALSNAGAARLGNALLGLVAGTIALLASLKFSLLFALLGFGGIGIAFSANTTARPAITRWLDRLGETDAP